jgi:hypothetical protein
VLFGCAAEVTGACPIYCLFIFLIFLLIFLSSIFPSIFPFYPLSALTLAQRAFAASFSFLRVAAETVRFFFDGAVLLTVTDAARMAPEGAVAGPEPVPGAILANSLRLSINSCICASIPAIASLTSSLLLLPPFGLGIVILSLFLVILLLPTEYALNNFINFISFISNSSGSVI